MYKAFVHTCMHNLNRADTFTPTRAFKQAHTYIHLHTHSNKHTHTFKHTHTHLHTQDGKDNIFGLTNFDRKAQLQAARQQMEFLAAAPRDNSTIILMPNADPALRALYFGEDFRIKEDDDDEDEKEDSTQKLLGFSRQLLLSSGKSAANGALIPSLGAMTDAGEHKIEMDNGRPCLVLEEGDKFPVPSFLLPGGLDAMMPVGV
jgi:hypothetical protein